MRASGFTRQRAAPHERALIALRALLVSRGRLVEILPVDGYCPDALVDERFWIDVKVPSAGNSKLAIAADEFEYQGEHYPDIRYLWIHRDGLWRIDTWESVRGRMDGGRRPPTENGANTDWFRFFPEPSRIWPSRDRDDEDPF